jgi:hypothetical protein
MWTFASRRGLARASWAAVVVILVAAFGFHWLQNSYRLVGGFISWPKLFWLMYAIFLWVVLPVLIAGDPRLAPQWRKPFFVLFVLMLARGLVELWMLYVSLNWSPWYGIAHDVLSASVLFLFATRLWQETRARLERLVLLHLLVTASMFGPEIGFAWYIQAHFHTQGEAAVYFVPDDPAYAAVLQATTAAVVFLSCYVPLFLYRWLHGSSDRTCPAAS